METRLPFVLHGRSHLRDRHDLQDRPCSWQKEPSDLPFDLLHRWFSLGHVCEGFWHCAEAYFRGKQPVLPRFNIRLHDPDSYVYPYTDELLQQGP